jgi:hypothetical protein
MTTKTREKAREQRAEARRERRERIAELERVNAGGHSETVRAASRFVGEKASGAGSFVGEKASGAGSVARDAVQEGVDRLGGNVGRVSGKAVATVAAVGASLGAIALASKKVLASKARNKPAD